VLNDYFVNNYKEEEKNISSNEQDLINPNYSNKLMLITGPNYSGKSVFLK